jgi:acyl carrier protein
MTSRETVHRAFSQVLDREPDEKGMEHYCAQLESGVLDSRGVEASLRASDEFARLQKKVPALKSVGEILAQSQNRKKRNLMSRAGPVLETIPLNAKNAAVTVCTYLRDNIDPAESKAVNTASGFIMDVSKLPNRRGNSYVLVTAAHAALPNPKLMFDKAYPFLVEPASREPFGCTQTELWPFDYIISGSFVDRVDGKTRVRFVEGDLLGIDREADTAVFELLFSPDASFEPAGAVGIPSQTLPLQQGARVKCFSDVVGMHSAFLTSGTVRLPRFQFRAGRRPFVITDMSLPEASSGAAVVLDTETAQLVAMHVASAETGAMATPYVASYEIPGDIVVSAVSRIFDAVNFTDSTGNVMIVVATNTRQLGMDGTVFTLGDLTKNLRLTAAEGYLFADSLSFHGLEGLVTKNDIVKTVNGQLLGAYSEHGQTSLYDVLTNLDPTVKTVDVGVLRKRAGGWRETIETIAKVPLTNTVNNAWSWWFAHAIHSVTNKRTCMECNADFIRECVVRLQSRRFPSPDPEIFKFLTTNSLLGIQFASDQQSERLNAIVLEVTNFWVINMRATNAFPIVAQLSYSDIQLRIVNIIVEQLEVMPEKILPESSFINDLGADSLDMVELIMAFEEAFQIEINDEETETTKTVQQAIDLITRKL